MGYQPKPIHWDPWWKQPKYADPLLWRRSVEEIAELCDEEIPAYKLDSDYPPPPKNSPPPALRPQLDLKKIERELNEVLTVKNGKIVPRHKKR